jgi:4,5-dihydroxyphthalate decarboxylase
MHTLIVRREIQDEHPWVATSLFDAFAQAKQLCYQDLHEADALKYSLPWLLDEAERTEQIMGKDFWHYGIESNRHVIQALVKYSHEQGLAARELPVEELFATVGQ